MLRTERAQDDQERRREARLRETTRGGGDIEAASSRTGDWRVCHRCALLASYLFLFISKTPLYIVAWLRARRCCGMWRGRGVVNKSLYRKTRQKRKVRHSCIFALSKEQNMYAQNLSLPKRASKQSPQTLIWKIQQRRKERQ